MREVLFNAYVVLSAFLMLRASPCSGNNLGRVWAVPGPWCPLNTILGFSLNVDRALGWAEKEFKEWDLHRNPPVWWGASPSSAPSVWHSPSKLSSGSLSSAWAAEKLQSLPKGVCWSLVGQEEKGMKLFLEVPFPPAVRVWAGSAPVLESSEEKSDD